MYEEAFKVLFNRTFNRNDNPAILLKDKSVISIDSNYEESKDFPTWITLYKFNPKTLKFDFVKREYTDELRFMFMHDMSAKAKEIFGIDTPNYFE